MTGSPVTKDGRQVVRRGGDFAKILIMTIRPPTRIALRVEGLTGIHAVRALWTALSALNGLISADVSMAGVSLLMDEAPEEPQLAAVLETAGVRLISMTVQESRVLPIL